MSYKIAVCGDSWFTDDHNYPGTSFTEILSIKNNWDMISLARAGASNFAICLQIDKAIEIDCDAVVIATTTVDRIEIPDPLDVAGLHARFAEEENIDWNEGVYQKSNSIANILYKLHNDSSTKHDFFNSNWTLMSDTIGNFLLGERYKDYIDSEVLDSLKHYLTNLYDPAYKRQIDTWILSDACRRLKVANKPFLIFVESVLDGYTSRPYKQEYKKDFGWISDNSIVWPEEFAYHKDLTITNEAVYHYDYKESGTTLANFITKRLNNLGIS